MFWDRIAFIVLAIIAFVICGFVWLNGCQSDKILRSPEKLSGFDDSFN